jgi:dihydromonapterin reductase/dihydrofolate reductase
MSRTYAGVNMPHILITGASRRLGLYLSQSFIKTGWQVTALTRKASPELSQIDSSNLTIIELDYGKPDLLIGACEELNHKVIDVIVHNASYFAPDKPDVTESLNQLHAMLQTHIELPFLLNNLLKDALIRSVNANIIHMTDIYVDNPNERFSNYCASKAGLENLSKSFAKNLAPQVRVNTIQPGALAFLPDHSDEAKVEVLEKSLLKIAAGFEPILKTIHSILDNPCITGTAIKVDGGRSICR